MLLLLFSFSIMITIEEIHLCNGFPKVIVVLMIVVYTCSMVLLKSFDSDEFVLTSDFTRHLNWPKCQFEGEIFVVLFHFLNPSTTSFIVNK